MILADVNILVHAFRQDSPHHASIRGWVEKVLESDTAIALSEVVLSGFLRVVTHPRVFDPPTPLAEALGFAEALRAQPTCVRVEPGDRHWEIFVRLCQQADARGNLIPDAYLAAIAIEHGCELVSTDRDFSRFDGLRWSVPGG
jgi:toxin-antitoxin system PIN domain toxin